jgi:hypothetical protein
MYCTKYSILDDHRWSSREPKPKSFPRNSIIGTLWSGVCKALVPHLLLDLKRLKKLFAHFLCAFY